MDNSLKVKLGFMTGKSLSQQMDIIEAAHNALVDEVVRGQEPSRNRAKVADERLTQLEERMNAVYMELAAEVRELAELLEAMALAGLMETAALEALDDKVNSRTETLLHNQGALGQRTDVLLDNQRVIARTADRNANATEKRTDTLKAAVEALQQNRPFTMPANWRSSLRASDFDPKS